MAARGGSDHDSFVAEGALVAAWQRQRRELHRLSADGNEAQRDQTKPRAVWPADQLGNQLALDLCAAEGQRQPWGAVGLSVVRRGSSADGGGDCRLSDRACVGRAERGGGA